MKTRALMALAAIAGVAAAAASAFNPQVQLWHFPAGTPLSLFGQDPFTGDLYRVDGQAGPGDFIRLNPNGTYFASLALVGDSTFDLAAFPGGPEFAGEGSFLYHGSIAVVDPNDPLAGFFIDLAGFALHIDSTLADAGGGLWRLTAQVLAHNGEFTHFDVQFEPLP
jgi:hypothetical protein